MKKLFRTSLASVILGAGLVGIGPGIEVAQAADGACSSNGTANSGVVGNFLIYKFEVDSTKTTNATCTFTVPAGITSVRFLSVSGGGGGGWDGGGGGGAGGVNKYDNYSVTSSLFSLYKGSNTAILRVASTDGTSADYTFTLTRAN